jgi:hypothetical protein
MLALPLVLPLVLRVLHTAWTLDQAHKRSMQAPASLRPSCWTSWCRLGASSPPQLTGPPTSAGHGYCSSILLLCLVQLLHLKPCHLCL